MGTTNQQNLNHSLNDIINGSIKGDLLDLTGNDLSGYVIDLSMYYGINKLKLCSCNLKKIPKLPPNLKVLWLRDNYINQDTFDLSTLPASVRRLDISYNSFSEVKDIPDNVIAVDISGHPHLTEVVLPKSCLTLTAIDCLLTDIKIATGLIKFNDSLQNINLSDNALECILETLPDDLCASLITLNVAHNRISNVDLSRYTMLKEFVANDNLITDDSVYCQSLERLILTDNELTEMPSASDVPFLVKLYVDKNEITKIDELPETLEELIATENPLKEISNEVARVNICAIADIEDDAITIGSDTSWDIESNDSALDGYMEWTNSHSKPKNNIMVDTSSVIKTNAYNQQQSKAQAWGTSWFNHYKNNTTYSHGCASSVKRTHIKMNGSAVI